MGAQAAELNLLWDIPFFQSGNSIEMKRKPHYCFHLRLVEFT